MPQPPPADLDLKELRKLHSCLSKAEIDLTESRPGEMVAKLGQLVAQMDRLAQVHGWKFVYPGERSSMCGGGPRVVQMKPTEQRTYAIFNSGKGQTPSSSSRADIVDLNRFNVSSPARSPLHHHDLTHSTSNSRRDRSASIEQVHHQVPLNTTAAKQQEPLMSTQQTAVLMKSVEELKAKVTKLWDGVAQDQLVVRKKFSELGERLDQRLAACEQQLAKTKEKVEVGDGSKYDGSTSAASDWNNYNGGRTDQHHYNPSSWGWNSNSNSNQEQGDKKDKNWWDKIEEQLQELDSKVEETKKENGIDVWKLGKRLEEVERENEALRGDNAALRARVEGLGEKIGGMAITEGPVAPTLEKLLALEHRESRKRKIKEIGEELLGLQQQSAEEEEKQAAKMKRKMLGLADADCGAAPFLGSAEAGSKLTTCGETARAHSKGTASSSDRPDEGCFFGKVCSAENFPSLPLPPESRGPLYQ